MKKRKHKRKKGILIVIILCLGLLMFYQQSLAPVDIVLDAGHGGNDPGAVYEDTLEKEITLQIAKQTKALLEESGYKVGMTRKDDSFVGLTERAEWANKRSTKIFVSIHCNASENMDGNGIETYYNEKQEADSGVLAEVIQKSVIERTNAVDRGVKTADFTVIVKSDMPSVLVEVGFLSNEIEREKLEDPVYQKKLAEGISAGIQSYIPASE